MCPYREHVIIMVSGNLQKHGTNLSAQLKQKKANTEDSGNIKANTLRKCFI